MKPVIKKTRYWWPLVATVALVAILLAPPAQADTTTWVGPTTNNYWSNPDNWDVRVPELNDDAFLTSTTSKTATLDTTTPLLNAVIVDASGGAFSLTQDYFPSGNLSATAETIGLSGVGVHNQYYGSNTVGSAAGTVLSGKTLQRTLVLGFNNGSTGTYNKNGGTLTTYDLMIGRAGTGVFNQPYGDVTVNHDLILGRTATGTGTYNISSGGLQVGGNETIGLGGVGNLNLGSGSHTIGGSLFLGRNAGTSGTYTSGSSNLSVGNKMFVGEHGEGIFSSSSGNVSVTTPLVVGRYADGNGSFTMGSGNLSVGGAEIIGYEGPGTFSHSSGTHTIGGGLIVGRDGGSTGEFTMSSGSIAVGASEIIGAGGDGSLTHTSGSHSIDGNLIVARDPGTTGSFTMSSGSLNVGGFANIGQSGTGSFTMTSGSTTIGRYLTLARFGGSSATFNIGSGSVTANRTPPFDGVWDIQVYSGGTFNINGEVTVTGDVINNGTVKTTDADVTWNGDFVNNNAYISDPSTQRFQNDMNNTDTGYIQATHNQDLFLIRGDFINTSLLPSTKNEDWDTNHARLRFAKGGVGNDTDHEFRIAGKDNGLQGNVPITAIVDNYAWRLLNIKNQDIYLVDGTAGNSTVDGDGAQYVGALLGADVEFGMTNVVHNIFGDLSDVLNIYYDPDLSANSYLKLAGVPQIFDYQSGLGQLKPYHTPLPPSVLLLGTGLLGLGALGWRRKRNC